MTHIRQRDTINSLHLKSEYAMSELDLNLMRVLTADWAYDAVRWSA